MTKFILFFLGLHFCVYGMENVDIPDDITEIGYGASESSQAAIKENNLLKASIVVNATFKNCNIATESELNIFVGGVLLPPQGTQAVFVKFKTLDILEKLTETIGEIDHDRVIFAFDPDASTDMEEAIRTETGAKLVKKNYIYMHSDSPIVVTGKIEDSLNVAAQCIWSPLTLINLESSVAKHRIGIARFKEKINAFLSMQAMMIPATIEDRTNTLRSMLEERLNDRSQNLDHYKTFEELASPDLYLKGSNLQITPFDAIETADNLVVFGNNTSDLSTLENEFRMYTSAQKIFVTGYQGLRGILHQGVVLKQGFEIKDEKGILLMSDLIFPEYYMSLSSRFLWILEGITFSSIKTSLLGTDQLAIQDLEGLSSLNVSPFMKAKLNEYLIEKGIPDPLMAQQEAKRKEELTALAKQIESLKAKDLKYLQKELKKLGLTLAVDEA